MAKKPLIAIAWFPTDGFAEFRAAQADAHRIPKTWEEWRARLEQQLQLQGIPLSACARVELDLATFRDFCRAHGLQMDQAARSRFASIVAAQMHRDQGDRDH